MPELPEVETTVKGLKSKVLNRAFVDVWSDWEKIIKKPKSFDKFKNELKGKKILKIWRRAKNIVMDLSDNKSLLIHQKMTGHLLIGKWEMNKTATPLTKGALQDKINSFIHVIFILNDKNMIGLSDARKFAKIELWDKDELLKEFKKLGPEPLEKNFTFDKFKEIFKNKKGKVKQIIMKQDLLAGIGNIYASEALWVAKIHPEKDMSKLSEKEFKKLYESIIKVLSLGVKLGGESFSDYRKVDGSKGDFDTERKAYKRENQKCQRCKHLIKRIHFGGRSAFYCPNCQKT